MAARVYRLDARWSFSSVEVMPRGARLNDVLGSSVFKGEQRWKETFARLGFSEDMRT